MKIHKFGGASIKNIERIKKIPEIIARNESDRLIIVISALGKTTNCLENIVNNSFVGNDYMNDFNNLTTNHYEILSSLLPDDNEAKEHITCLFDECRNKVIRICKDDYDYYYDQIVSYGEIFSSYIVYRYFMGKGFDVCLKDARQLFMSDKNWRSGNINVSYSMASVKQMLARTNNHIIITQGFIAGTISGDAVTLGREGSDYSAAMFADFCNADEVTFWKDVDGIYSADPNIYDDAVKIDRISYDEMIELSYFGAKVLHKKTLLVLMDKNVTTRVRSFLSPEKVGTALFNFADYVYPPIRIILHNQVLITAEHNKRQIISGQDIKVIYDLASEGKFDINLFQISALKVSFCITYNKFSCEKLFHELKKTFIVKYNVDVTLETVRHYTERDILKFISQQNILLTQISRSVAQFVKK